MSRKGKEPIKLPKGVSAAQTVDVLTVKGPKGTLTRTILPCINLEIGGEAITVTLKPGDEESRNFHGMTRALIQNMVTGVAEGFETKLEMIGVGYRAAVKGHNLDVQVGLSHPLLIPIPTDIQVTVDKNTTISVKGVDKQKVGQFAATVRGEKPPEVYQGKGIRYVGEYVRKKAAKAAAKTA